MPEYDKAAGKRKEQPSGPCPLCNGDPKIQCPCKGEANNHSEPPRFPLIFVTNYIKGLSIPKRNKKRKKK